MRKINKIKIYFNNNDKSKLVADKLKEELNEYNFEIVNEDPDLCISIGGDGSFLRMVKDNKFNSNVKYIGINAGTLGFLQEINIEDTKDFVKRLNDNKYKEESINIQETVIKTKDKEYVFNSLNEIVIRQKDFNTLKVPIYVDDEYLERLTGDGVLISTSTGSTAYNMSFGGAIVYNTLNTLSITPIAPLNNKVFNTLRNTVIIPGDKKVTIKTPDDDYNDIFIAIDGDNQIYDDIESIETYISDKKINCLRMNEFHFIKVVNNKILNNN